MSLLPVIPGEGPKVRGKGIQGAVRSALWIPFPSLALGRV
jgi:hypothetical protein